MKVDPSAKKMLLRDWMTATIQIAKTRQNLMSSEDIAALFNDNVPGLKMTEKWVDKALYGFNKTIKP